MLTVWRAEQQDVMHLGALTGLSMVAWHAPISIDQPATKCAELRSADARADILERPGVGLGTVASDFNGANRLRFDTRTPYIYLLTCRRRIETSTPLCCSWSLQRTPTTQFTIDKSCVVRGQGSSIPVRKGLFIAENGCCCLVEQRPADGP